jgi:hypothetical protein
MGKQRFFGGMYQMLTLQVAETGHERQAGG